MRPTSIHTGSWRKPSTNDHLKFRKSSESSIIGLLLLDAAGREFGSECIDRRAYYRPHACFRHVSRSFRRPGRSVLCRQDSDASLIGITQARLPRPIRDYRERVSVEMSTIALLEDTIDWFGPRYGGRIGRFGRH